MGLLDEIKKAGGTLLARVTDEYGDAEDVPFEEMHKALIDKGMREGNEESKLADPTEEKPRAMFHDPYSITDWGGWRERWSSLGYDTLLTMSVRNTVVAAIIEHRIRQVSQFCRPQQSRYDKGYRIILRDRRDAKKKMTDVENEEASKLERMIETTGFLLDDERPADRDNFTAFCKKFVRDTLVYDQACFEKIPDRRGKTSRFIMLPSATIRPAVSDVEHLDPKAKRERVAYVQIFEDTPIAEFTVDQLAWCVMNPRSDLRVNGFGFSPLEELVNLITAWLFGFEYNTKFFSQGAAIKGIINIKGAIPDRQLKAFRKMWYAMVTGVANAWKTPILNSEDIQWLPMHSTNREMEYSAWMDFLTKLSCAIYGIDPIEINFQFGNTGQSSTLNQPDNEKKVVESKDKGLRPLMEHIADALNRHIIQDLNPDFEFVFTGLDAKSEDQEREGLIKAAGAYLTVNEVRAKVDEEPLPGQLGEVIENPVWLQWAQAQMQQQAMQPPGANPNMMQQVPTAAERDKNEDMDLKSLVGAGDSDEGGEEEVLERAIRETRESLRKAHVRMTFHGVEIVEEDEGGLR